MGELALNCRHTPSLDLGRRNALCFTGDTTKSSSGVVQSCVVGAETDGILS